MPVYKSKSALGKKPIASLTSALVQGILYEYTTEANLVAGDIINMGPIETDTVPVDCKLITDDLDTNGAPTLTLTVGILNAAGTDIDVAATSTWIAASTVGQTGGVARATTANCYLSGASSATRMLGVKAVAGAATGVGAGKKLAVLVECGG